MDGLQASAIIRREKRLEHDPRIVMVTAFGREEIRRAGGGRSASTPTCSSPSTPRVLYDTLMNLFGVAGRRRPWRASAREADSAGHDAAGVRILLVEDNEMNQQVRLRAAWNAPEPP